MQPVTRRAHTGAELTLRRFPRGLAAVGWVRGILPQLRLVEPAFADAVERVFGESASEASLEDCLGISTLCLGEPWQRLDGRDRRNACLHKWWKEFYPGIDSGPASREIATRTRRYACGAWVHDQAREAAPRDYNEADERRFLFSAFKAHEIYRGADGAREFPRSAKQIKRILDDIEIGTDKRARDGRDI
jgi:hypothetical protein